MPDTLPDNENQQLLLSWLAVIGAVTMFWAPVERYIDQSTHLTYERIKKNHRSRKKPLTLSEKLKFIREHNHQEFDIEKLSVKTLSASKARNICVHGCIDYYDESKIRIGKTDGRQPNHTIEIFTFDRARLEKIATELTALQDAWEEISLTLIKRRDKREENQ